MTHIYISPHLDDAVLSCAGLIFKQVSQGEDVQVINLFAGIPNLQKFSEYAEKQHRMWELPPDKAILVRRQEDNQALSFLGAKVTNWDNWDAIYRSANGEFLYTNHEKLFGLIHADEQPLIEFLTQEISQVFQRFPEATFYAPLRIGGHVDHLVARSCAAHLYKHGMKVIFYEDFPYVAKSDWPDEPKTADSARAELNFFTRAEYVEIDILAKLEAQVFYKSQMKALFGEEKEAGLIRVIHSYISKLQNEANSQGYYERYWVPIS